MAEYDATQKPLRLNYLTVDPSGSITLVIDGHAQPGPTKAELDVTYGVDVTDYDEVPVLRESIGEYARVGLPRGS